MQLMEARIAIRRAVFCVAAATTTQREIADQRGGITQNREIAMGASAFESL